ncbi:MAG: XdhC family protein [Acidobacteriota bacterium]
MNKQLELWQFIATRLTRAESVMLLVVAESSGSSPGRQGYKMAVGADGELFGSIGGGVMEVNLVEESRALLSVPPAVAGGFREQVHQKNSRHASGMICSGKQTVVFFLLSAKHLIAVSAIAESIGRNEMIAVEISGEDFKVLTEQNPPATAGGTDKSDPPAIAGGTDKSDPPGTKRGTDLVATDNDFRFTERLGFKNDLYIIGGGHCALALSELMSKMDFHISLFDDRPELNTIEKNRFAHEVTIIDRYENIGSHVLSGERSYVVVMTLGYKSDEQVIRALIDKEFKYFGVLGSNAKMSAMFKELIKEGLPVEKLDRIRTPVGIPIHSRTPEEIAVSIAAEIISVKNSP